jgi:hypothetical protein
MFGTVGHDGKPGWGVGSPRERRALWRTPRQPLRRGPRSCERRGREAAAHPHAGGAHAIVASAEAEDARRGRSLAAPLLVLAFGSGARLGELLALPWGTGGPRSRGGRPPRSPERRSRPGRGRPLPLHPAEVARLPPQRAARARGVARLRRRRLAIARSRCLIGAGLARTSGRPETPCK